MRETGSTKQRRRSEVRSNSGVPGTAEYKYVHHRVNYVRGKAASCVWGCVADRYEWANLTDDYDNLNDYAQMCRSCHRRYDFTRASMEEGFVKHSGMQRVEKITPEMLSAMCSAYEGGVSMRKIADYYHVDYHSVNSALHAAGVVVRTKSAAALNHWNGDV